MSRDQVHHRRQRMQGPARARRSSRPPRRTASISRRSATTKASSRPAAAGSARSGSAAASWPPAPSPSPRAWPSRTRPPTSRTCARPSSRCSSSRATTCARPAKRAATASCRPWPTASSMLVPRFPYQFPKREIDRPASEDHASSTTAASSASAASGASQTKDGKNVFGPLEPLRAHKKIGVDPELAAKLTRRHGPRRPWTSARSARILKKEVGFAVPIGKRKYDKKPIGSDIEESRAEERP